MGSIPISPESCAIDKPKCRTGYVPPHCMASTVWISVHAEKSVSAVVGTGKFRIKPVVTLAVKPDVGILRRVDAFKLHISLAKQLSSIISNDAVERIIEQAFFIKQGLLCINIQEKTVKALKDFLPALEGDADIKALKAKAEALATSHPMPGWDVTKMKYPTL